MSDGSTKNGVPQGGSVAVELDEALVADPEVVGDLVQDDAFHLALEPRRVAAVEPLERAAEDRDLVRRTPP